MSNDIKTKHNEICICCEVATRIADSYYCDNCDIGCKLLGECKI